MSGNGFDLLPNTQDGRYETQLDRIEAQNAEILAIVEKLLERKKPKKSLLTEWIVPPYIDQEVWNQYLKLRKEKQNSMTESIYMQQLKRFDKWHKEKIDVNKIILKSVENGWIGFFTEKEIKNFAPEITTASHDRVDFAKMAQAERELDAVDPYASLK